MFFTHKRFDILQLWPKHLHPLASDSLLTGQVSRVYTLQHIDGLLIPTGMCAPAPPFFGVTDGVEKVTLRPFPVVWPPVNWSTVRGFILTQADKFALRKYLSRLKLVFASDTGSYTLYFLACLVFSYKPLIQMGFVFK